MQTIAELPEYIRRADKLLSAEDRLAERNELAALVELLTGIWLEK